VGAYIVRRVLWAILLLLVVSFLTFVIFNVFPSADPAALRAGRNATPALVEQIRRNLGLDKPFYVQYWNYLKGLVTHFNLGYSYYNSESVKSEIFCSWSRCACSRLETVAQVDRWPATVCVVMSTFACGTIAAAVSTATAIGAEMKPLPLIAAAMAALSASGVPVLAVFSQVHLPLSWSHR